MKLDVYDDFFLKETYDKLLEKFANPWVLYGWKSHEDTDPHGHFNHDLTHTTNANLADVSDRLDPDINLVWNYVKAKLGNPNLILLRSYLNAHTYGTEGYYHRDTFIPYINTIEESMHTVVVYITDTPWDRNWGGETSFLPTGDYLVSPIHPAVLPAPNRVVVFGSNELHCARSVTRKYYGFRRTLMFKYREPGTKMQEKLSRFLCNHGADKLAHAGKSSLHDHLLRVYSMLETAGVDEYRLVGGLHSVYGTNAFQHKLIKNSNPVTKEFSQAVSDMVALFSDVNRPSQFENPAALGDLYVSVLDNNDDVRIIPRKVFDGLRLVECANLIDQGELNKDKYPNLWQAWRSK